MELLLALASFYFAGKKKIPSSEGVGATNLNAEAKGDTRIERVCYDGSQLLFTKRTFKSYCLPS